MQAALGLIADEIRKLGLLERIGTVGHRIVHGGHSYAGPDHA